MYFTINQMIIGRFSRSLYVGSKMEYLSFAISSPKREKPMLKSLVMFLRAKTSYVIMNRQRHKQSQSGLWLWTTHREVVELSKIRQVHSKRTKIPILNNHLCDVKWTVINVRLSCNCWIYFKLCAWNIPKLSTRIHSTLQKPTNVNFKFVMFTNQRTPTLILRRKREISPSSLAIIIYRESCSMLIQRSIRATVQ